MADPNLTLRQQRWFDSVRANFERESGRSLAQWVEIARSCPESGHRARLRWLKDHHGLLQNRASLVLSEAFGSLAAWNQPEALIAALWADPAARAILDAVDAAARALPQTVRTARKGYTAWSRRVQFAALRPLKGGKAMLGLAVAPERDARLEPPRSESWSERLTSRLSLAAPGDLDDGLKNLLHAAWERA